MGEEMKLLMLRKKACKKGFLIFNLLENEFLVTNLSYKNPIDKKFKEIKEVEQFLESV